MSARKDFLFTPLLTVESERGRAVRPTSGLNYILFFMGMESSGRPLGGLCREAAGSTVEWSLGFGFKSEVKAKAS